MFDYYGIYDIKNDSVYLIPSNAFKEQNYINLNISDTTKNNQTKNVRFAKDYTVEKILRGHTPNTN